MEKVLPRNWVECSIADVFEIVTGNTPSKSYPAYYGNEIPWVKPGDINKYAEIFKTEEYLSIEGFKKSRKIPKGSVLITCIGNLGNTAIAGVDLATNQQINSIVINHKLINNKYVYYYSKLLKPWLIENSTSTTISMVNKSNFEKASFIFPPLSEQNRIVEKLDRLFGQLEVIKSSMKKIPVLLKNFRQQVLTQAVTGKLTEEWREGKELEDWRETKLSIIADIIDPHPSHRTPSEVHNGIPYIGIGDIDKNGEIDFTNARKVSENILNEHLNRYTLRDGDFIFGKIGTIGRPIIIPSIQNYTLSANVILIKPRLDVVNSKFLFYYLDSPVLLQLIKADTKSTSQPAYGIKKMREQIVPLPSTKEQKQIVSRVESLFAKADTIEEKYKNLKAKIETLPQTTLHKAFKGELSEQLEGDGDARDLLEEIVALKNGGKAKKVVAKKYVQPDEVLRIVAETDTKEYSTPVEKTAAWYDERFELWVSQQGLAARGSLDKDTLRELFDAMDDEDK